MQIAYIPFLPFTVGLTASCFGLGATLSNFLGQMVVEQFGHVTSLVASLLLSFVPLLLFLFMPETMGMRTQHRQLPKESKEESNYEPMEVRTFSTDGSYGSFDC